MSRIMSVMLGDGFCFEVVLDDGDGAISILSGKEYFEVEMIMKRRTKKGVFMKIGDMLDLINKEKRINERAAAAQKIGVIALIAAGAGVGVAGIVLAVKLKRKMCSNLSRLYRLRKKRPTEKGE